MSYTDPAAYTYDADWWCPDCLPVPDDEVYRDAVGVIFEGDREQYKRGLWCSSCHEEIFPDTWKVTLSDNDSNSFAMTVEVKRRSEKLDNTLAWTGRAYSATITLIDVGETETFDFYTECIYDPSPVRALNDLREMMEYSKDYNSPCALYKEYRIETQELEKATQEAVRYSSRWYESLMLRQAIVQFFGIETDVATGKVTQKWFDHFENGDYDGEGDW